MNHKKTEARLICERECAKKNNLPIKDFTLGRKIYNQFKNSFKSEKQAYDLVRTVRGHKGSRLRPHATQPQPLNYDSKNSPKSYKDSLNSPAKVLVLDIETAPLKGYFWQLWKQNIQINQITNDWFIFTWAAKWLFEDKVYSGKLTGKEAIKQDDKRIMKGIWAMLNEADIVITHNGKKFDMPKLNTRFLLNGLTPPLPYQQIDTCDSARKMLAFSSNKQEFISIAFGSPRKLETGGFELWDSCYKGDEKAIAKMEEYNIGDIISLELNYLKLRPYIMPHPNMGLFIMDGLQRCPSCGSDDLQDCGKDYRTTVAVYELKKCNCCGASSRVRKQKGTPKEKHGILSSSPR